MYPAFITMAILNAVFMAIALFRGYAVNDVESRNFHLVTGLFTMFYTVLVHCAAMFYLIATGKGIKEVTAKYQLDKSYIQETKNFKKRVFPFATFSILLMLVLLIFGALSRNGSTSPLMHGIFALIIFAFNTWSLYLESYALWQNFLLMNKVDADIVKKNRTQKSEVSSQKSDNK